MTLNMRNCIPLISYCLIFFICDLGFAAKEKAFFISHAGAGDPFWNVEFKGAKQAAKDLQLDLQIMAPEKPNDIARQVQILKAAIASKPDGIAISITDNQAFSESLKLAKEQGINVIAFNSQPSPSFRDKNPFSAFVGMDEFKAGQNAAKKALELGAIKKKVVFAIHQAGHIGLEKRYAGIKDILDKHKIEVDKLEVGDDASRAQVIFSGYLNRNPEVTGVFCAGPAALHPIGRYLQQKNKSMFVASFDLSALTLHFIKEDIVSYTVDQQPYMQGYLSVVQLALASRAMLTPSSVDTGVGIVDKAKVSGITKLVKEGKR